MKSQNLFFLLGGLSCLLVSCSLSQELDKIDSITSVEATVSLNANVLNDTLYLKDLISSDNLDLKENPLTGDYSFGFENTSNYKVESVFFPKINTSPLFVTLPPEFTNPLIPVPAGEYNLPKVTSTFTLQTPSIGSAGFPADYKISVIKLKTGAKITVNLNNELSLGARIKISVPKLTKNGLAYSKTFDNIAANEISALIIDDLNGYSLNADGVMGVEIETTIKKTSIAPISGSKMSLTTTVDIADHHEFIQGFFGEIVLKPDPILVDVVLPAGLKKVTTSDMIIKEAVITLTVSKNNLTVPFDLDLTGEGIELVKTTAVNDKFQFKILNLNILNLAQLKLTPKVTLNKGLTTGNNEIMDTSTLAFKTEIEVPMDITSKDLIYEQEDDNSFYEAIVEESEFDFKDGKINIIGSIISDIPLGASLQVYYRNTAAGADLLSLFDSPIEIKSEETKINFTVTKEKLDLIKKHPFQVIKLTLNGSGKINSNQKISFKIGLAAKGTFSGKI
jgi:hypothetical protein